MPPLITAYSLADHVAVAVRVAVMVEEAVLEVVDEPVAVAEADAVLVRVDVADDVADAVDETVAVAEDVACGARRGGAGGGVRERGSKQKRGRDAESRAIFRCLAEHSADAPRTW